MNSSSRASRAATPPRGAAGEAHVFDFRAGRNRWGFALHAFTWCTLPPRTVTKRKLWRKRELAVAAQASVMVHATPEPRIGDRVLISGESGKDWDLLVAGVEAFHDPQDMFTLTLEFDRPPIGEVA